MTDFSAHVARMLRVVRKPSKKYGLAVTLFVAFLLASGCSGTNNKDLSSTRQATGSGQATMSTSGTGSKSQGKTNITEGTLSEGSHKADVTLRVEGGRETRFSGLCTVGDDQTVLTGKVPKQFNYNLNGNSISCRIQKQDSKNGSLRVILLAGDTTRSVQQTNAQHGTINVSYSGK